MSATILVITAGSSAMIATPGYVIGAVIALLIMGYLVYSLIKPEKF
jgi:K+-transporting ATPase KdpF subunit